MSALRRRWHAWLTNARAGLLADERSWLLPLLRVVVVGWMTLRGARALGGFERALRRGPALLDAPQLSTWMEPIGLWPLPAGAGDVVGAVIVVAGICAVCGVFTRVALAAFTAAFFVEYAVIAGGGFFPHTPALPGQLLLALTVLPGSTALGVDRLWVWWRRRRVEPGVSLWNTLLPPAPRFGSVGVLVVVGLLYAATGIAKLRFGAAGWWSGTTLRWYLENGGEQLWLGTASTIDGYSYVTAHHGWAARWGGSTALVRLLSWLTLAIELSAPLCLLRGGWLRVGWVAAAVAFHIGVAAVVGPRFSEWIAVDLCLIAPFLVERGRAWARRRRSLTAT